LGLGACGVRTEKTQHREKLISTNQSINQPNDKFISGKTARRKKQKHIEREKVLPAVGKKNKKMQDTWLFPITKKQLDYEDVVTQHSMWSHSYQMLNSMQY